LNISREGKEELTQISPLIYNYTISFSWQTLQRTATVAELPAILDSFYTTITNDHIGVEVGGDGEPRKWQVFPHVEVDMPEGLI